MHVIKQQTINGKALITAGLAEGEAVPEGVERGLNDDSVVPDAIVAEVVGLDEVADRLHRQEDAE